MSEVPHYEYDESIGLYGWQAKAIVAQDAILSFARLERGLVNIDEADPELPDHLRMSTLASKTQPIAYAMVIGTDQIGSRTGAAGELYAVDTRNYAEVIDNASFFIPRVAHLSKDEEVREITLRQLILKFNKAELEAMMRMAGKLTAVTMLMRQIADHKEDRPTQVSYMTEVQRRSALEPNVMRAIRDFRLDALSEFYGSRTDRPTNSEAEAEDITHILEWTAFIDLAKGLFRRETDSSGRASVAIHHEIDTNDYYINAEADAEGLSKITILRYDETQALQKQVFDLRASNGEDDLERLRISPVWDRKQLLRCLQEGTPIPASMYESYAGLSSETVVDISEARNRRAA